MANITIQEALEKVTIRVKEYVDSKGFSGDYGDLANAPKRATDSEVNTMLDIIFKE